MNILSIDTSTTQGSVSLLLDSGEIITRHSTDKENYSTRLFRWLEEVKAEGEMGSNFTYIDAVVVTSGPGTFTGLRVGIATAKAVAIAVDCPLLHYPTLDIMAEMRNENATMLRPLVVAGRGQVYTALYKGNKQIEIPEAANPEENHLIPEDNDDTLFFGNGTELFNKEYRNTLPDNIKFQDEILPLTPTLCKRALANLSLDNFKPEPLDITYLRSATS